MESVTQKIIHIDMDCFYAAVEELDNPELKGKPVVVGGNPHSRGVVSTCNYEARKYGIHSAMPTFHAYKRCPHAIFVKPHFERYKAISEKIREIFARYTDSIEPLSLDEAYLDVTGHELNAVKIAQEIRKAIQDELGLTASAGVSNSKLVAKVASDHNKPNGITIVLPGQVKAFIGQQKVRKIPGVGPKMEERLHRMNIRFCHDAWKYTYKEFYEMFGKWGEDLWYRFQGIDHRRVSVSRERKSLGQERTFSKDILDLNEIKEKLFSLADETFALLEKKKMLARTLTIKVKYEDFKQITRSQSHEVYWTSLEEIKDMILQLMEKTECGTRAVRLLGVSFANLTEIEENSDAQNLLNGTEG